jgi:hypothetical protein
VFGTVGISFGGLLSFYGTKLLPKSMWGSLEAIKSLHRNGGEWVWFMAMMCIYLGIQPHNDRPVSRCCSSPLASACRPVCWLLLLLLLLLLLFILLVCHWHLMALRHNLLSNVWLWALVRQWNKTQLKWGWVAGMLAGSYMVFNAPSARGLLAARMAAMAAAR